VAISTTTAVAAAAVASESVGYRETVVFSSANAHWATRLRDRSIE